MTAITSQLLVSLVFLIALGTMVKHIITTADEKTSKVVIHHEEEQLPKLHSHSQNNRTSHTRK